MNLSTLREKQSEVDHINILSYEGDIYLAEAVFRDHNDVLKSDTGAPMRFQGISQLKEKLSEAGCDRFNLVFNSPYDEMI